VSRLRHLAGLACLGAALSCSHSASRPEAAAPLGDRLPILGGRLTLQPPRGTKSQPRNVIGIMGADEPDEEETRLRFEEGHELLVILADEWVALAADDERTTREKTIGALETRTGPLNVTPFASATGAVRGWLALPDGIAFKFDDPQAGLVLTMVLVQPDGTLQGLGIFANRALARRPAETIALARRIAATVEGGGKRIGVEGDRVLPLLGESEQVRIHLPAGFAMSTQNGPDFLVHRLRKIVPIGTTAPIGYLYSGFHPQRPAPDGENLPSRTGTLLGRSVQWTRSRQSDLFRAHAQVRDLQSLVRDSDFRPLFDVALYAQSSEELDAMIAILESAQLIEHR